MKLSTALPSNDKYPRYNQSSGYVLLLSVLIIGAVGVAIALTLLLSGVSSTQASLDYQQSIQSQSLANACAEEALEDIRQLRTYAATTTLTYASGTCTAGVAKQVGQNRIITSTGTAGGVVRKVKVIITSINPQIIVSSWQEVSDF